MGINMNTDKKQSLIPLHNAIEAVAPIFGVSVPNFGDPTTVRIDFKDEATDEQRKAAQAVLSAYDWVDVPMKTHKEKAFEAIIADYIANKPQVLNGIDLTDINS